MAATYVKWETPAELKTQQLELIEGIKKKKGKIKVGVNECTKAIERGVAKLVLIAEDVSPAEVVMHIPMLCKEKNVPFSYISTKKELGERIGVSAGASVAAIVEEADMKKDVEAVVKRVKELAK